MADNLNWADVKLLHQMELFLILWFYLAHPSGEGPIGSVVRRRLVKSIHHIHKRDSCSLFCRAARMLHFLLTPQIWNCPSPYQEMKQVKKHVMVNRKNKRNQTDQLD